MVTLDYVGGFIRLDWTRIGTGPPPATLRIRCTGLNELTWELTEGKETERDYSSLHRSAIRSRFARLRKRFFVAEEAFSARARRYTDRNKPVVEPLAVPPDFPKWRWLEEEVVFMARDVRILSLQRRTDGRNWNLISSQSFGIDPNIYGTFESANYARFADAADTFKLHAHGFVGEFR